MTYAGAPFLSLAAIECCICVASVLVTAHVRRGGGALPDAVGADCSPLPAALLFGVVVPLALLATSLRRRRVRSGALGAFLHVAIGFAGAGVTLVVAFYLVPSLSLERAVFGPAMLMAFLVIGIVRPVFVHRVAPGRPKRRVLVLGAGERAQAMHRRLRRRMDRHGFRIVGHVALPTDGSPAVPATQLVALEGRSLLDGCTAHGIDEIVVAADERREGMPLEELLECRRHGLDVIDLPGFFEREQGRLPLDVLRPDRLIYSGQFERGASRDAVKRLFDVLAGLTLLAIAWPIALLVAIGIKLEDGVAAPVLRRETRIGLRGRPFELLAFRSTRPDTGRTGIGGLPRILNLLRGDMSLVGPRPERPRFVAQLSEAIPFYRERHAVRPGLTGWAQVRHPCGESLDDAVQRQELDLYYVKNHTLFLDALVLCRTVGTALFGPGTR